jgi:hypothetical protein
MDNMFTYRSPRRGILFIFNLGLGIGLIGPAFDISIVIFWGYPINFFGLLLNREIGLIVHLFD